MTAAVKDAQVQVAAVLVDGPVMVIGIEDAVNYEIREAEEKTGDSSRVLNEAFAFEESVEDETSVRKSRRWNYAC